MINDYKKINKKLNTKSIGPIFFVTPNPIYAIGLEKIIKNYFVICSQKSDIIHYLQKEKVSVLCLNDDKIKNAGKILTNERVIEYIKNKSKSNVANVITFKPSPMIQRICKDNSFRYLGNDWKLNRDLEDKIKFVEVTEKLKISNANSKIIKLDKNNCSLDFSRNKKFVAQLPRGFSGNATFFIEDKNDLDEMFKKYENRKVKLSEYFKGETYTINACVIGNEILISKPIFQITGLSSYNKNSFGTCGNDYIYPEKLKKEQRKNIFDCTKKVGDYIKEIGYKGIFGLDFVISDKKINLIEINPRIIGSMSLFTKLQIQNNQIPFLSLSILEFVASVIIKNDNFKEWDERNSFNASQLILRNTKSKPIKITKSLKSGIYKIKENKLVFRKEAYGIDEKMKENEFLIQCSAKGRVVSPDIEYANVQVSYGIMKDKRQFKSCFSRIINLVLENINTKAL
ncbi:MAG: ATP-grasp domain-containing protein [Patescibacteria group bacterium]|nr:ATP-grasp domain-containing protein [Patescibacteria group bacterium]